MTRFFEALVLLSAAVARSARATARPFPALAASAILLLGLNGASGTQLLPFGARVTVLSSETSAGVSAYRLRVEEHGAPIIVLVPAEAGVATLEINGVERQRVGHNLPVAMAPLGHGVATFYLAHLTSADRVTVRVWGSPAPLRFLGNADVLIALHDIGFWSGIYYAILITVAIFQVVGIYVLRDPALAWYFAFTLSMIATEVSRDGAFPGGQPANVAALIASSLFSAVCVVGFSSSYLRLRSEAPRLWAIAIVASFLPIAIDGAYIIVRHQPLTIGAAIAPYLAGLLAWVVITVIRRRSGYTPATYLAIGLFGLTVIFSAKLIRDFAGVSSPFLDRWSFELGSIFDTFAFSLGVTLRSQYLLRERKRLERDLTTATYEASHDVLTGLLNRRGIEALFDRPVSIESTVLFLDLDDFKLVNDSGGHAAGDDTLRIVARILRHAVREGDVAARVGGDEFVLVLVGHADAALAESVIARISAAIAGILPLGTGNPVRVGVSIGRTVIKPGGTFAAAVARADADAYRVKGEHYARTRALRPWITAGGKQ